MASEILEIKRVYADGSRTQVDGVVFVIKTEAGKHERVVSHTVWASRSPGEPFFLSDMQLTEEQIEEVEKLFTGK